MNNPRPTRDMIRQPDEDKPLPPLEILPGPPTQPGWHRWSDDRVSRGIMVRVVMIEGELKGRLYFRDDVPDTEAKGYW